MPPPSTLYWNQPQWSDRYVNVTLGQRQGGRGGSARPRTLFHAVFGSPPVRSRSHLGAPRVASVVRWVASSASSNPNNYPGPALPLPSLSLTTYTVDPAYLSAEAAVVLVVVVFVFVLLSIQ